jgi:predicted RNase H-like HicB family nuclease
VPSQSCQLRDDFLRIRPARRGRVHARGAPHSAPASAGSQRCSASGPVSRICWRTNGDWTGDKTRYDENVKLTIDLDREEDGRWIADALELPGVMCYGRTRDEAISNTERLAIEVIADRIAHQELPSSALNVSFTIPDEQLARQ